MVIILDGINNLPTPYHDLKWLPLVLPPKVVIILSSSQETKIMDVVKTRSRDLLPIIAQDEETNNKWMHIPIQPFTSDKRQRVLQAHGHTGMKQQLVHILILTISKCLLFSHLAGETYYTSMCQIASFY